MATDHILLIDDEPYILDGLRRILERRYTLGLAGNADEALALLETSGPFAAVVCDLKMPGMGGLELLRELRRRSPDTVRMVLSGTADMTAAITAVNDGEVFRFHTKPVPTDVLLASVAAAVARYNREGKGHPNNKTRNVYDFPSALKRNELRLFVQPQYDITHNRICGIEALIRWQHPKLGLLLPGAFLADVEAIGAITQLTDWIMNAACAALATWRRDLDPTMSIAVNITANDLGDPEFPGRVKAMLTRHQLPPQALELELVEGAALDTNALPRAALSALTEIGVALSLDDFGTGYSAFGYLRHLPIHKLKIDRIFVSDIATDANALHIIEAIIGLGQILNLTVIAEGVETKKQMDALNHVGCHLFQGFHIARPIPMQDFPNWFAKHTAKTKTV
ncbi:MAG: EAL domain-containing response regulator [Rhodospirillaceae bacterium]|nr:EAL domain-containing response regulator [Rhodospirillaceae bacterium]